MAKKQTQKSKYPSRYSPNGWVHAAQYVTELICEKKAKTEGKELPLKFWELKEWLKETDYITATYSGYSVNKDKVITLLARDPQPTDMYISINGLAFTDQEMALAGNCCNNCGTIIEEEDSGAFWAKVTTNGDIKKLLCPTCTQNHSHLKHQYKNHVY